MAVIGSFYKPTKTEISKSENNHVVNGLAAKREELEDED
ncbi:hypothetical protein C5167_030454 [Papaver somniferum]|nr:hypothetical protein C5167_030454 [Papaver somniferum]